MTMGDQFSFQIFCQTLHNTVETIHREQKNTISQNDKQNTTRIHSHVYQSVRSQNTDEADGRDKLCVLY